MPVIVDDMPNFREVTEEAGKFLRIHDNISYFADYFPNVCLGQRKPLPCFCTVEMRKDRVRYAQLLAHSIQMYSAIGTLRDLTTYVFEQLLGVS